MNPFATQIRKFRKERKLSQKEAANLLGWEQSYLCAIERGIKSAPQTNFVNVLIEKYRLTGEETKVLLQALKQSERRLMLPLSASEAEFELISCLREQIGQLKPHQIEMMKLALKLNQFNTGCKAELST